MRGGGAATGAAGGAVAGAGGGTASGTTFLLPPWHKNAYQVRRKHNADVYTCQYMQNFTIWKL